MARDFLILMNLIDYGMLLCIHMLRLCKCTHVIVILAETHYFYIKAIRVQLHTDVCMCLLK